MTRTAKFVALLRAMNTHGPRAAADHMESLARERDRAVEALAEPKWQSVDRDNMEFAARITCWQMDRIRAALSDIDTESEGER